MKINNETENLNEAIIQLQQKHAGELILLKEQMHITCESFKPINIIKSVFRDVSSFPTRKNNVVDIAIGLSTGYLSKKLLIGKSDNPVKKLIGIVMQFAIAKLVSKNTGGIKSTVHNLYNRFSRKSNNSMEFQHNGKP